MEYSRKDFEKIQNEVIEKICQFSKYTPEESKQIYITCPYYIMILHKLNKGATTADVACFILNELEKQNET